MLALMHSILLIADCFVILLLHQEMVVTTYKSLGYNTLMCGDGTNDVGALKHAHVGVALLSAVPTQKDSASEKDAKKESSVDPPKPLTRTPLRNRWVPCPR